MPLGTDYASQVVAVSVARLFLAGHRQAARDVYRCDPASPEQKLSFSKFCDYTTRALAMYDPQVLAEAIVKQHLDEISNTFYDLHLTESGDCRRALAALERMTCADAIDLQRAFLKSDAPGELGGADVALMINKIMGLK